MHEPENPTWQKSLQEALAENDATKLQWKLEATETALFLRAQELAQSPDGIEEVEEIRKACREIARMQGERLKWPSAFDVTKENN
jgi:hypothetical protein